MQQVQGRQQTGENSGVHGAVGQPVVDQVKVEGRRLKVHGGRCSGWAPNLESTSQV